MTPKTIPCPGSPAAAAPASSLSTSPTRSDSDEPTARRHGGRQVKGQRCQVGFQEPPGLLLRGWGEDNIFFGTSVGWSTGWDVFSFFSCLQKEHSCLNLPPTPTLGRSICR